MSNEFHQTGQISFSLPGLSNRYCQPIENYTPDDSSSIVWKDIAVEAIKRYLETHCNEIKLSNDNCVIAYDVIIENGDMKIQIENLVLPLSNKNTNNMNTKFYFIIFAIVFFFNGNVFAQQFSASTSYGWDQWQTNQWGYIYQNGWCYAVAGERYEYLHSSFLSTSYKQSIRPVANARDFYFRFKYSDLNLHELTKKEWREIKKQGGWIEGYCEFEYYISDQYPTLKSALSAHSWPCAKKYVDPRKPVVLKKERVRTKVYLTDDDEVRALNFFFSDSSFALSVHWDYSGYTMTYSY